jgi:hypothetical protein
MHNPNKRQATHIDTADAAPVEVVCVERITAALIGILTNPAGTQHPT